MRILSRRQWAQARAAKANQSALEVEQANKTSLFPAMRPSNPLEAIDAWREMEGPPTQLRARWHPNALPLRIRIATLHDPEIEAKFSDQLGMPVERFLLDSLKEWTAASMGQIRFVQVFEGMDEDIEVLWTDTAIEGRDYEVGHTKRKVTGSLSGAYGSSSHWVTHATITLLTRPIIDQHLNHQQQLQRLRTTFLHEIGHALGLEHADSKHDIMYHRGWRNLHLSEGDARRLQKLYEQKTAGLLS